MKFLHFSVHSFGVPALIATACLASPSWAEPVDRTINASALPAGYISWGGLTWMKNNAMPPNGYASWSSANRYCTNTKINGQTGWRLPTNDELKRLYGSAHKLLVDQGWTLHSTWSSTPGPSNASEHYFFDLGSGGYSWRSDEGGYIAWGNSAKGSYVTCVR